MSNVFTKEFPYTMEAAWNALHKTSYLDVDAGSEIERISDDEWYSHTDANVSEEVKEKSKSHCTTTYDDGTHTATIEDKSATKNSCDYIHLSLTEIDEQHVSLTIDVEINTGVHVVAKMLMHFLGHHMTKLLTDGIFKNFDALCSGKETHRRTKDEISEAAQDVVKKNITDKLETTETK